MCDRESLALVCLDLQVYQEFLEQKVCLDQRETPVSLAALVHLDDLDLMAVQAPKVKRSEHSDLKPPPRCSPSHLIGWNLRALIDQVSLVHLVFLELVVHLDPL